MKLFESSDKTKRYKLICCEVLYRECCAEVARSLNQIDVEFIPKGLHDIGAAKMLARLQELVDRVDGTQYDAILLGYALCNNGLAGLAARDIPIVLPRGHDCITLFLGSRQRYLDYFNANPGTYFQTTGWLERGSATGELSQLSIQRQIGMDQTYNELVEKYGEDNAKYLWETLCDTLHNYGQITYIGMGLGVDEVFEQRAKDMAKERGWCFAREQGDMRLIRALIQGEWDESDFLIIQPGQRVVPTYGEDIVRAEGD